mmetsp:Transcript_17152/g.37925  ORF Transcript_17152/g.37925 Transcript_17152/m.37925 type:complete len:122 (-) Transcript_17152:62-427(-)
MPGHRWMAHAAMGNLETAFEALKTARWPASDAAFTAGNDVPPDLETRAHGARRARRRLAGTYGFATSLLSPGASIAVDNGLIGNLQMEHCDAGYWLYYTIWFWHSDGNFVCRRTSIASAHR